MKASEYNRYLAAIKAANDAKDNITRRAGSIP